ncbi:MAG: DUF695 domain-containing protein [Flavobacteriaceae bacterium]|nr:DUF695 domain-containing protein [Flavobacteriaceae bacterium]
MSNLKTFLKNCKYCVGFLLCSFITNTYAQTDWVNYLAEKEKGLMSIYVDLYFNNKKPNYKNLLIIGSTYKDCFNNGFPKNEGLDQLYSVSDATAAEINQLTDNKLVGVITYQCVGYDVYYVKDTIDLRSNVLKVLNDNFSNSKHYVVIRKDRTWEYYFDYLYPDNVSDEFFTDHQYLNELALKGDDLSEERAVNHYFYFKSIKNRVDFINKIKVLDYAIDSVSYKKEAAYPYELQVSKKEFIDPESVKASTTLLKLMSEGSKGLYQGWATEVQIDD